MTQNTAYPLGPINPAITSGSQLASYVDALRDNLYSSSLGTAQPSYSKAGMLWSKQGTDIIDVKLAVSPTVSADIGTVDTITNRFKVNPEEFLVNLDIGSSTAYSINAVEDNATIYEITGTPTTTSDVIFPVATKPRRIQFDNMTGHILRIRVLTQSPGVSIPAGTTMLMYYNGDNIEPATSAYLTSGSPVVTGTISGPTSAFQHVSASVDMTLPSITYGVGAIGPYGSTSIIGAKGDIVGFEYRAGNIAASQPLGFAGFSNTSGDFAIFNSVGTPVAKVDGAGHLFSIGDMTSFGTITAYSDKRLKTDISTIEGALEKVKALRGVNFTRITGGRKEIGVIAQEVQKVIPEVVHQDNESELLHVAYGNIVGLLIEAIKELSNKVESR